MTSPQTSTPDSNNPPRDEMLESAVEDICRFVAKLKHAKQNDEQIQKRLTDAGLSIEAAKAVTKMGLASIGKDSRAGRKNLLIGAVLFIGGGLIALSILGSTPSIGRSLLSAAVLVGLFLMLLGWIQLRRAPQGKAEIRHIVERIRPAIKAEDASRWKIAAIKIHNP